MVPWRIEAVALYALVAIVARFASRSVVALLFITVLVFDILSSISFLYNLSIFEIALSAFQIFKLDLTASWQMTAVICTGAGLAAITLWLMLRYPATLASGQLSVFAVLVTGTIAFAAVNTFEPHYHFGSSLAAGRPMESAAHSSGFVRDNLDNLTRPALLVVVEALGRFADPRHQALIDEVFKTPSIANRYTISSGFTTYYGSTTAAEMRELCFSREPYSSIADTAKNDCLPGQFAAHGRSTVAIHNFAGDFFDRRSWYPIIGFQRRIFAEDIQNRKLKTCGSVFNGPCDTAMIPVIRDILRATRQPKFLYWLTLSTHVPVIDREGTPRLNCDVNGGSVGNAKICYMTELWIDVIEGISRLAQEFAPMDVLIVGDHAPPLWTKTERSLFVTGQVPWFRLSPRRNPSADGKIRKAAN